MSRIRIHPEAIPAASLARLLRGGLSVLCVLVFLLMTLAAGCEAPVEAFVDRGLTYSMYGVLTPMTDSQRVLVFPVEEQLNPLPGEPLDVHFNSTDLETGEVLIWRDSLIQEDDGDYVHAFWAPFRAAFGRSYRLVAERSDGRTSTVEVHVPVEATLILREPNLSVPVSQEVVVSRAVPRLNNVSVAYIFSALLPVGQLPFDRGGTGRGGRFFGDPPPEPTPPDTLGVQVGRLVFDYGPEARQEADGWVIRLNLAGDFQKIRDIVRSRGRYELTYGIQLEEVQLRLVAASADWIPPEAGFGPDVLVQPGTLSNVESGFGFVGAGYVLQQDWLPPPEVRTAAGYTVSPEE